LKLTSSQSLREEIRTTLQQCRISTLYLVTDIDSDIFTQQAHSDFSPVGWHLGHIAFTEAYWILEYCAGNKPLFPQYRKLFAADGLPKSLRQNLPPLSVIQDYLATVREEVLTYLETAPLVQQEPLWRWLIQHESQHGETICFLLQLHRWRRGEFFNLAVTPPISPLVRGGEISTHSFLVEREEVSQFSQMVEIPGGEFAMGSNSIDAIDNEKPAHLVYVDTYWIDKYPVTCKEYRQFMEAGGYQKAEFWSEEGWKWLGSNPVAHPLYWSESKDWDNHPVCGVSWYEAEAYARFVGKRLPTEAEWEKAATGLEKSIYPWGNNPPEAKFANYGTLVGHTTPVNAYPAGKSAFGCYDLLGNVWEWTSTWFDGYSGFKSYPYAGYSAVYFDRQHRVLKGGSWATRPWALRNSFRNWYHPHVRQILAGFRLVS